VCLCVCVREREKERERDLIFKNLKIFKTKLKQRQTKGFKEKLRQSSMSLTQTSYPHQKCGKILTICVLLLSSTMMWSSLSTRKETRAIGVVGRVRVSCKTASSRFLQSKRSI
jgi:hypothetical protein